MPHVSRQLFTNLSKLLIVRNILENSLDNKVLILLNIVLLGPECSFVPSPRTPAASLWRARGPSQYGPLTSRCSGNDSPLSSPSWGSSGGPPV